MRRPPLAVVAGLCAVAGAALGAGGTALLQVGAPEAPAALPVVAHVAPSVLERPQRPADLAGVSGTPGLRRSTLRRVGTLGTDRVLLVGRDTAGGRCIVALAADRGLFAAGCVPEPAFASAGTRVSWTIAGDARQRTAEWAADGTVRAGAEGGAVQAGPQNVAQ